MNKTNHKGKKELFSLARACKLFIHYNTVSFCYYVRYHPFFYHVGKDFVTDTTVVTSKAEDMASIEKPLDALWRADNYSTVAR